MGNYNYKQIISNLNWLFSRRSLTNLVPIINKLNKPAKELSEALAVFNHIYNVTREWDKWTLIDLCSGKFALLSAITVLNTRNSLAIAVDIEEPNLEIANINRLVYLKASIYESETLQKLRQLIRGKIIVVGIHCCKTLSLRLIEMTSKLNVDIGYLVPCCSDFPTAKRLGLWNGGDKSYRTWVKTLVKYAERKGFNVSVTFEPMLSDKNALIMMVPKI